MKENLLWILTGLVVAGLIFYGGVKYEEYRILNSPVQVTIDTTYHEINLPLKDTIKVPVNVYKPDVNRKKYIDSLIQERVIKDSLIQFINLHLSQFGEIYNDTVIVKDSISTFIQFHGYDILADPMNFSLRKTDIYNKVTWTLRDTTTRIYIPMEPTIFERFQDAGTLTGVITTIYLIIRYIL
jgi:hypothetical protein